VSDTYLLKKLTLGSRGAILPGYHRSTDCNIPHRWPIILAGGTLLDEHFPLGREKGYMCGQVIFTLSEGVASASDGLARPYFMYVVYVPKLHFSPLKPHSGELLADTLVE